MSINPNKSSLPSLSYGSSSSSSSSSSQLYEREVSPYDKRERKEEDIKTSPSPTKKQRLGLNSSQHSGETTVEESIDKIIDIWDKKTYLLQQTASLRPKIPELNQTTSFLKDFTILVGGLEPTPFQEQLCSTVKFLDNSEIFSNTLNTAPQHFDEDIKVELGKIKELLKKHQLGASSLKEHDLRHFFTLAFEHSDLEVLKFLAEGFEKNHIESSSSSSSSSKQEKREVTNNPIYYSIWGIPIFKQIIDKKIEQLLNKGEDGWLAAEMFFSKGVPIPYKLIMNNINYFRYVSERKNKKGLLNNDSQKYLTCIALRLKKTESLSTPASLFNKALSDENLETLLIFACQLATNGKKGLTPCLKMILECIQPLSKDQKKPILNSLKSNDLRAIEDPDFLYYVIKNGLARPQNIKTASIEIHLIALKEKHMGLVKAVFPYVYKPGIKTNYFSPLLKPDKEFFLEIYEYFLEQEVDLQWITPGGKCYLAAAILNEAEEPIKTALKNTDLKDTFIDVCSTFDSTSDITKILDQFEKLEFDFSSLQVIDLHFIKEILANEVPNFLNSQLDVSSEPLSLFLVKSLLARGLQTNVLIAFLCTGQKIISCTPPCKNA